MPEKDYVTRAEHREFSARIREHNQAQDDRLDKLEEGQKIITKILATIEKLTTNMENMCAEQKKQGEALQKQADRLEELKDQDGRKWRSTVKMVASAVVGVLVGYIFKQIGIF